MGLKSFSMRLQRFQSQTVIVLRGVINDNEFWVSCEWFFGRSDREGPFRGGESVMF